MSNYLFYSIDNILNIYNFEDKSIQFFEFEKKILFFKVRVSDYLIIQFVDSINFYTFNIIENNIFNLNLKLNYEVVSIIDIPDIDFDSCQCIFRTITNHITLINFNTEKISNFDLVKDEDKYTIVKILISNDLLIISFSQKIEIYKYDDDNNIYKLLIRKVIIDVLSNIYYSSTNQTLIFSSSKYEEETAIVFLNIENLKEITRYKFGKDFSILDFCFNEYLNNIYFITTNTSLHFYDVVENKTQTIKKFCDGNCCNLYPNKCILNKKNNLLLYLKSKTTISNLNFEDKNNEEIKCCEDDQKISCFDISEPISVLW